MQILRPTRLPLKILFLVTAGIITLTLLVACNGLPTVAPSPAQESKEPAESPAEEVVEIPTREPPEAVTSEKLPGAKDFTDNGKPSNGGALLGSPAVDMFLKIDGVPGESTDDKHKEWIEILSYDWGVSQPGAGTMSSGGARSAERSDHSDFSVVKTLDKTSPKLALFVCNGTHIPEVIIEFCRDTGDKQKFMEYKMTDVIISSVNPSGSTGDVLPFEEVMFAYGTIEWTYTEIDSSTGKAKGDVKAHWDLVTNSGG
jgi:type VI secretion system secreted protein Hcp